MEYKTLATFPPSCYSILQKRAVVDSQNAGNLISDIHICYIPERMVAFDVFGFIAGFFIYVGRPFDLSSEVPTRRQKQPAASKEP